MCVSFVPKHNIYLSIIIDLSHIGSDITVFLKFVLISSFVILKLFTPCTSDQYIRLLRPTKCTISITYKALILLRHVSALICHPQGVYVPDLAHILLEDGIKIKIHRAVFNKTI